MDNTINELLHLVRENDVRFIHLGFCDPFGTQKSIAIMAAELPSALSCGVSFDAHAIRGFRDVTRSDLALFPDISTMSLLPWRPGTGRVMQFYCDVKTPDGAMYGDDGRTMLKRVMQRCADMNFVCRVGAECEFYLFKTDENQEPTYVPHDKGGYMDIPPLDKGDDIRREICLTLEEMGVVTETAHHEQGPGQNEIDFQFSDALTSADNFLTFKSVVKAVSARNGLFASFLPKPIANAPGSGLHVNLSLTQNGKNIFTNTPNGEHRHIMESFIAGILSKVQEMTLFLNPLTNSYERFGAFEAPMYVSWSPQNRSQLIRMPAAMGEKVRMELRSPDPSINPYIAFSLIVAAGLDGIEHALALPEPVDADLYNAHADITSSLSRLPQSLEQAISAAERSQFARAVLGDSFFDKYIQFKRAEAEIFAAASDKDAFFHDTYFGFV